MALVHEIRRRGRHILPQVLLVATLGYFGYHIVQGEHGVLAWLQLEKELRIAKANAAVLNDEKSQLEHRVSLLRPDSLDPDLLEERARVLLNYAHGDEMLVLLPSALLDNEAPRPSSVPGADLWPPAYPK
jgi:cell division protein FtsB